jgi:hypothetical protein
LKHYGPSRITSDGINIYVVDFACIRKIAIATGEVTTLAGVVLGGGGAADGVGAAATFDFPRGITTDGTSLYLLDNNKIRKVAPSSGTLSSMTSATAVVSSLTGVANAAGAIGATDGAGASATFYYPSGITTDGTNLYVSDNSNNKIRKIVIATGVVSSLTGVANAAGARGAADGSGTAATFSSPFGITTDGTNVYVVDYGNSKIRKIAPSSGTLSSMTSATAVVSSLTGVVNTAGVNGAVDGAGVNASFALPDGITTDGTNLYVADSYNNKIRKIAPSSGTLSSMTNATAVVSSLTGLANTKGATGAADGAGSLATFYFPHDLTSDGTNLYVADPNNSIIRKIQ